MMFPIWNWVVQDRLQYGLANNLALTLTSGYYNFFGKNVDAGASTLKYQSLGMVPVKAGVKAFFSKNMCTWVPKWERVLKPRCFCRPATMRLILKKIPS